MGALFPGLKARVRIIVLLWRAFWEVPCSWPEGQGKNNPTVMLNPLRVRCSPAFFCRVPYFPGLQARVKRPPPSFRRFSAGCINGQEQEQIPYENNPHPVFFV